MSIKTKMAQSSSSSYLKPDDNTIKQWFAQLQEFKSNETFCDITLKAENKEILAHRVILAISIPFFSGMLQNNYKENRKKKVEIKEIDPLALDSLVNLSYGVELEIDHQNAAKLLKAADYLHLDYVKKACEDFLKSHLTLQNVLETKRIAEKYSCGDDLVLAAEEFIDNNFPDFAKTDEFLELEKHDLIEIIKRDELKAKEEEVYQAVMKWIKYEGPERIEQLQEVLSNVRLCLLSPEFLCNSVSKESLIKASHECRDLLDEARDYHIMPGSRQLQTIRSRRRRNNFKNIYILGGQNSNRLASRFQIYDMQEDKWISKDCVEKIKSSGSAVFEGKMYIFGGHSTSNQRSSETRIFDINTEHFTLGRNMSSPISSTAATVLGDGIYVCGGHVDVEVLNFHQRYSPKLDKWTQLAPLNQKRSGHGAVALNGQIYAIGGWSDSALNSCERYDPLTNTWSFIKPMASPICYHGVAVLNGKIFVCGGWNGRDTLNSVEVYDPVKDEWTQAAPVNTKRSGHAFISLGGKLYAIGGKEEKSSYLSSCEVYDSETDSWSFVASLIAPASYMSFGVSSN